MHDISQPSRSYLLGHIYMKHGKVLAIAFTFVLCRVIICDDDQSKITRTVAIGHGQLDVASLPRGTLYLELVYTAILLGKNWSNQAKNGTSLNTGCN